VIFSYQDQFGCLALWINSTVGNTKNAVDKSGEKTQTSWGFVLLLRKKALTESTTEDSAVDVVG
jgi:hypothetical protein